MNPNNSLSGLPFYSNIEWQNRFNPYTGGHSEPLLCPSDTLLPLQIIRPKRNDSPTFIIHGVSIPYLEDITGDARGLVYNYGEVDVIVAGSDALGLDIPTGNTYYLEVTDGVDTWYSEPFKYSDVSNLTMIEYSNTDNILFVNGLLHFAEGFKFKVYLPTLPAKPDYKFEEDVVEKEGYSFILKQHSYKEYKLTFEAHEFLCDLLRIVRMCDNVTISYKTKTFKVDKFDYTVDWLFDGNFASVECTFRADTVIKSSGAYMSAVSGKNFNLDFGMDYKQTVKGLSELSDVNLRGVSESDLLQFTGDSWTRMNAVPVNLGDLSDVNLTNPTEGDVLQSQSGKWVNSNNVDIEGGTY